MDQVVTNPLLSSEDHEAIGMEPALQAYKNGFLKGASFFFHSFTGVLKATVTGISEFFNKAPQLIIFIIILIFIVIFIIIWSYLSKIYKGIAKAYNTVTPNALNSWNSFASVINSVADFFGGGGVPTVGDVNRWRITEKMPTAFEFATVVLTPIARAVQKSITKKLSE